MLVIADDSAHAEFVAADLLAQAEHDPMSQALLVTTCAKLAQQVAEAAREQLLKLSRRAILQQSIANSRILIVRNLEDALAVSDSYAPEHLIIQTRDPRALLERVQHAGSVFLGSWSPEPMGDYCSGTNHVLPTYGYARAYSGLSVQDFTRRMTVQELSRRRPARSRPDSQHAGAAGGTGCPRRGGRPAAGGVAPGMHRLSWLTEIARPEIRALQAYQHAVWEPGLVRLHANELPWRASGDRSIAGLNRYPEPHPHQLTAALARFYGVGPEMLLAGRGSDELIDLLIRSYCRAGQDAVIICPPTFGMYAVAARIQGARVIEVAATTRRRLSLRPGGAGPARRSGSQAGVPVFAQQSHRQSSRRPGHPRDWRARCEGRALVVVDEAYVEFAGEPSLIGCDRPIIRAWWCCARCRRRMRLAGARCGALLATCRTWWRCCARSSSPTRSRN